MRKRILFLIIIFLAFFAFGIALKVKAGESHSARGWIWGGSEDRDLGAVGTLNDGNETGMGWINANCASQVDTNGNNIIDSGDEKLKICNGGANNRESCNGPGKVSCGVGISCVEACSLVDYGVDIPSGSGDLSGYAWSENLGWIDFGNKCTIGAPVGDQYKAASCTNPDGGTAGVSRSGNNLVGWARIVGIAQESVSGNSGGWKGWIKMNGTAKNGASYGIQIDSSSNPEKIIPCSGGISCAWNGENDDDPAVSTNIANGLGWFDFSNVTIEKAKTLKICVNSCSSGENITGIVKSIALNDPISLKACYNTSSLCNDNNGDFTDSAIWNETNNPNDAVSPQPGKGNYKGINSGTEQINVSYDGKDIWTRINVGCTHDPSYCELDTDPVKSLRESTCKGSFFPDNCESYSCPGSRDCTGWIEAGPE